MLHLASLALSCLLLFGTATAPAAIDFDKPEEPEVTYQDTPLFFDGRTDPLSTTEVVRRDFISKDTSKYNLAIMHPTFAYTPAVGACAPIAGANVLGFYDRYDENLIPDHESGTLYGTGYIYRMEDQAVAAVTRQLYDYMGTDEEGSTEDEFLNGLKNYCKEKGRTLSTSSCMSWGSFSFSKAKSYIESNQPIVFFLSGYNVGFMAERDTFDSVSYLVSTANHVMVGFGYSEYSYVTTDGNVTDYYFAVASGLVEKTSGIYNINYKTKIIDALAINIY